ncbi:response regulator [Oscillatoriales cyanobacterium LEGE 11467]|uniref:Circadian input-output histidine kinase CikA n=1 Tax=Zarconia navalis LEGE 11467 TaxID=1828826 RepID=A0A928VVI7_9CYAN|nr:response regulator [Zarconia navalis]MBE9039497.1 response regulator [Zarconia navalis LEGE 11467]
MEKQNNILIVDDTPENLQVLSKTLSQQGYKVRGVVKGEMAIKSATSSPPDLILLDIKMPDMNGYEVCEQLKKSSQTRDIPIVFLSALDEVFDKVKGFKIGGVDYITKPFQIEEVLARIENQLTIQRLQKQLLSQNEVLQLEIQERKKAEEVARAASQAKSQFLANMSHELRTPLNAILGFSQVLDRDADLTIKQRDYIGIIHRSSQHLLELINGILDLAKIESGQVSLNESCFDIYRLFDRLEEMFQIEARQRQLTLLFLISANVPQYIKADEQKLRGCLINLIGNGIKFTRSGNITIAVTPRENPSPANDFELELVFSVRDTGMGIAAEDMDTLFDAFVQAENGKQCAEGTGLGLAIARQFVRLMGGDITLTSTLGRGSTFEFNIQASHAHCTEECDRPNRRIVGLDSTQSPYRIAIVDDNRENRLLLAELLGSVGFEIREAEQGLEGVRLWESWHPHLMFVDTRMPVMNGLEATRQIRTLQREQVRNAQTPPSHRTAIVALTASAFEDRRGEILAAGSDDFMHKPFREESIFEILRRYLGIDYVYEERPPTKTGRERALSNPNDTCILEELAAMPKNWLVQLEEAASKVREGLVLELINGIPADKSILANSLRDLARDFRLDRIAYLVEKVRSI